MSDHHWLSEAPFERIQPPFPRSHGVPRGDDHRVVSEGPKPDRLMMDATHLKAHRDHVRARIAAALLCATIAPRTPTSRRSA